MSAARYSSTNEQIENSLRRERRPPKILCRGVHHFFGFPVEPEVYKRNRKSSLEGSEALSAWPFRCSTRRAQVSLRLSVGAAEDQTRGDEG